MSWITIAWSMMASACLTLAFVHLLIWVKQRAQYSHLLYATFAVAVACFAAFELLMMRAETVEQFRLLQRWIHVPVFFIIVSTTWFVRLDVRTVLADGGNVEVSVSDEGKGIPGADLERVFEPFITTKAHGMGLGLAVCRTIVDTHAGRIWAANNADRGATFYFTIPVNHERKT